MTTRGVQGMDEGKIAVAFAFGFWCWKYWLLLGVCFGYELW